MRTLTALAVTIALLASAPGESRAESDAADCLEALDRLGVAHRRVRRPGIAIAVQVRGLVGGIEYRSYSGEALVLDCSLVHALASAGPMLRARGIERVNYSSAYQRRNIRGTSRPSRHSFGLAIDVHTFALGGEAVATVKSDYEQGLGDADECVGEPLTQLGGLLRAVECDLVRSDLFRALLTPDFDPDHYNHFHLEALPWSERAHREPPGPGVAAAPPARRRPVRVGAAADG
jgi:hypothetical protein